MGKHKGTEGKYTIQRGTNRPNVLDESSPEEIGGEQRAKKPRIDFMPNLQGERLPLKDVDLYVANSSDDGVACQGHYVSRVEPHSFQEVKDRIRNDNTLFQTKRFLLYPAFKDALLKLVDKVEEVKYDQNNQTRVILVHGVPTVGKSSLAACLAYYLSLAEGEVRLKKLAHSKTKDTEALTQNITNTLCAQALIVDQVNTGSLQIQEIKSHIDDKFDFYKNEYDKVPLPLILFTSGHFAPQGQWLNWQSTGWLCYKVIHMRIDDAVVSRMRASSGILRDCVLTNSDLLGVADIYSRMCMCLEYIESNNAAATLCDVQQSVFPTSEFIDESTVHLFWLAWQRFLVEGIPSREDFVDDQCNMKPHYLEYLSFLFSRIKDTNDSGINAIWNSMDVTGSTAYSHNNYTEYKPDDYYCKFSNKNDLYDVLVHVVKFHNNHTTQQNVNVILRAFNLLRPSYSQFSFISGRLFELLIKYQCQLEGKRRSRNVGMTVMDSTVDFPVVSYVVDVATVQELCKLPTTHEKCKVQKTTFWCVLNLPGKPAFKGYDFAYMMTIPKENKPMVSKLELFQVTVNPSRKTGEKRMLMTDVLTHIKTEIAKLNLIQNCDVDSIIVPFFLHHLDHSKVLELPIRKSNKKISVEVLSFPQELFLVKDD